jgi:hypothetical protein
MRRPTLDASRLLASGVVTAALVSCSSAGQNDQGACPDVLVPLAEYRLVDVDTDKPICGAMVRVTMDETVLSDPADITLSDCGFMLWNPGEYSVHVPGYRQAVPDDEPLETTVSLQPHCGTDKVDIALRWDDVNL